ncbi:MAG: FHA domain-containing protein [Anaerolineae bacterium]|nr:FHA domain-containing protein [Anaerolineae bacterium]MDQ7033955.1 FHA domain-containing protein [Anaerolineae bacterium]
MVPPNHTSIFTEDSPTLHRVLHQQVSVQHGTASLGKNREVILLIRGLPERLMLTEDTDLILGRFSMDSHLDSEVNLSPYGADDRGVSRHHACLQIKDNHLYITDLGSTNGTFIAGKRLNPQQPTLLHKGVEILLGRLQIQILFR